MSWVLALCWGVLVGFGAWCRRPEPRRFTDRLASSMSPASRVERADATAPFSTAQHGLATWVSRIGDLVIDRLPPLRALPQLWVGVAALAVAAVAPWAPVASMVIAGGVLTFGAWSARRQRWRRDRGEAEQMVTLMQLLAVTVGAGATLRTSLIASAERLGAPLGPTLIRVRRQLESGATIAEALERFSDELSAEHRVAIERIRAAELAGAPIGSLLRTSASSLSDRRRRDAEVRARRLPVFMLLPLVCCVLPAFVVLAIVPMVVSGGSSLFPL